MKKNYKFALTVLAATIAVGALLGAFAIHPVQKKPLTWPQALEAFWGPPEYKKVDFSKPLREQTRIVEIGGRRFEIPIMYIDGVLDVGEHQKEGIVLEYVFPDFKSKLEYPNKEDRKKILQEGRKRGMLLEDANTRPAFDVVINLMKSLKFDELGNFQEKIYGLEKHAVVDWQKNRDVQPNDTYIERSGDGKVKSYIRCSHSGQYPTPSCSHRFIDKGLLYEIRWNLSELPNWRSQQAHAVTFIESFEINKNLKGG